MRHHAVIKSNQNPDGVIPFTEEEEAEVDAEEKIWLDAEPERLMATIRETRDGLLAETDHYALRDVDLSDEMITYRQALRDLPATVNIDNPVFPEKP